MKITRIYDYSAQNRKPVATVVTSNAMFGAAVCNESDQFNKRLGVHIATERMKKFGYGSTDTIGMQRNITTHDGSVIQIGQAVAEVVVSDYYHEVA